MMKSGFFLASVLVGTGWSTTTAFLGTHQHSRLTQSLPAKKPLHLSKNTDVNPMAETSRLSHVMLRVPSVDMTVAYWTRKGGSTLISRNKDDGSLMSAFVALGSSGKTTEKCFGLEIVSTNPQKYELGNVVEHIGVSMLLQFQNNLLGAASGEKPQEQGEEPNGILVKSAASAPGDYFSRISFKSKDLASTQEFYSSLLGMEVPAADEQMLCMRYKSQPYGVPTTLVFEATKDELIMGNCFDHLVIETSVNIDAQYERLQCEGRIFMKPTEMFGKKVMGIKDPNGYKVIIASE
jgi:catechol 2,3-dioxygenase-like lactoylglutathione lyase family enzyme